MRLELKRIEHNLTQEFRALATLRDNNINCDIQKIIEHLGYALREFKEVTGGINEYFEENYRCKEEGCEFYDERNNDCLVAHDKNNCSLLIKKSVENDLYG